MSKVALKMMTGTKVNGTTISPGVALGRGKAESGDASRYSDCWCADEVGKQQQGGDTWYG